MRSSRFLRSLRFALVALPTARLSDARCRSRHVHLLRKPASSCHNGLGSSCVNQPARVRLSALPTSCLAGDRFSTVSPGKGWKRGQSSKPVPYCRRLKKKRELAIQTSVAAPSWGMSNQNTLVACRVRSQDGRECVKVRPKTGEIAIHVSGADEKLFTFDFVGDQHTSQVLHAQGCT